MIQKTPVDRAEAAKQVRATLRGPVVRTLAEGIPEIRNMPGSVAYEKVMGDIGLLEKCFLYFRESRGKFATVLVDEQSREVNDDHAKLSCGRTLNEVVAMIVRSAAFRYFNRRLGDHRPLKLQPQKRRGLLSRLFATVTGSHPKPLQPSRSKAELLYEAIRQYLLYEWQVPLVPAYSQLSPSDVSRLGPRLVELRSEDDVMVAAGKRKATQPPTAVADIPADSPVRDWAVEPPPSQGGDFDAVTLEEILTADRSRLNVDTLGTILLDGDVREAAGNHEKMTAVTAALRQVSAGLIRSLTADVGLGKRQMTVCLLTAQRLLPPSAFEEWVRGSENSPSALRFMVAAKKAHLSKASSLADCAAVVVQVFSAKTTKD